MRAWYEDYKARVAGAYRGAEKQSKPNLSCSTFQCIACANMRARLGFRVEVKQPFCTTLVRGPFIVDVYVHLTIGSMIYMDGQELLSHVYIRDFNGLRIKSLESCAEALVSAAHAVYKERIYTLNDYFTFTIKEWTKEEIFKLAKKLRCTPGLNLAMEINEAIEKGLIEAPYRIPVVTWTRLLVQKIVNDPLTSQRVKTW